MPSTFDISLRPEREARGAKLHHLKDEGGAALREGVGPALGKGYWETGGEAAGRTKAMPIYELTAGNASVLVQLLCFT